MLDLMRQLVQGVRVQGFRGEEGRGSGGEGFAEVGAERGGVRGCT